MKTQSLRQRIWRYAPLVLWMVFISFASTDEFSSINTSRIIRPLLLWFFPNLSEQRLAVVHFLTRKAAHFSEYALLGLLAGRTFYTSSHQFLRRFWFRMGLFLIVVYALLDEYHQSFVPSRTASIYDSGIDVAGGLAGLVIFGLWFQSRQDPGGATGE
jgi:VanZ family protein